MNRPVAQPPRIPGMQTPALGAGGPFRTPYAAGYPTTAGAPGLTRQQQPGQPAAPQNQNPQNPAQNPYLQGQRLPRPSSGFGAFGAGAGANGNGNGNGQDAGLDLSDFPALGSAPSAGAHNGSGGGGGGATSYATQAGTGGLVTPGSAGASAGLQGVGAGAPTKDFTPDDFPALGQQHPHPQQQQQQQQAQQQPPQPTQTQQPHPHAPQQPQQANPEPPGLNGYAERQQQQQQQQMLSTLSNATVTPGMLNLAGTRAGAAFQEAEKQRLNLSQPWPSPSPAQTQPQVQPQPQTQTQNGRHTAQNAAQQVLTSPADRWGLLGLLASIRGAPEGAFGVDLASMGLDMGYSGNLYSSFITPWADQGAAGAVEPEFHLPACYNVAPPPPGPAKVQAFSEETLFFMFYSSPRDALQEIAAQELWNRSWRFHKDLRIWITKESGAVAKALSGSGESGTYTVWDPEAWAKDSRELQVLYQDLEEKGVPAFAPGPGIVPNPAAVRA